MIGIIFKRITPASVVGKGLAAGWEEDDSGQGPKQRKRERNPAVFPVTQVRGDGSLDKVVIVEVMRSLETLDTYLDRADRFC